MASRWTKEEVKYLQEHYGKEDVWAICDAIGKSRNSVIIKASRMGFAYKEKLTNEQKEYIDNKFGEMSVKNIAKSLGKNPNAVKSYMRRNDFGRTYDNISEKLRIIDICELLGGIPYSSVAEWIRKKKLKSKKIGYYRTVTVPDFIEFLKKYPNSWDASKCERWWFESYDLEWFEEKRKADFKRMVNKRWQN